MTSSGRSSRSTRLPVTQLAVAVRAHQAELGADRTWRDDFAGDEDALSDEVGDEARRGPMIELDTANPIARAGPRA